MPTRKKTRPRVPAIITAVVQPVSNCLSRMEDLLIEMRAEQDVSLKKMTQLQRKVDELTLVLERRRRK